MLRFINSTDTSWLKIVAPRYETTVIGEDEDGEENHIAKANGIEVLGSLKIDSIKMTSWDVSTNSYALNEGKRNLKGTEYEVQLGSRDHLLVLKERHQACRILLIRR